MESVTDDGRMEPGKETAQERYDRLREAGEPTGWAGYCSVADYCTRQCRDCGACARAAEVQ